MFSNILGSLTSLLPKNFIFSAFIPVLIFGFINALILYESDAAFRAWTGPQISAPLSMTPAVLFVAVVVVAYILTTINDFLREVLEGKHLWPPVLARALRKRQVGLLSAADDDYDSARTTYMLLTPEQQSEWSDELTNAEETGRAAGCTKGRKPQDGRAQLDAARVAVRALEEKVSSATPFDFNDVTEAVSLTIAALRLDDPMRAPLSDLSKRLRFIIDYARNAAAELEARAYTRRQTLFGTVAEPTSMGNVAASIQSYATNRYGIDLDLFWSRLQYVLQKGNDAGYATVVDSKTQLDFLISCFWLAFATTAGWLVAFAIGGWSIAEFLAVAIAGPIVIGALYLLAVTNYLSYGEVVRAAIDLNRFALLDSLQLRRPAGNRDEVALWRGLRRVSVRGGRDFDLSYEKPKP